MAMPMDFWLQHAPVLTVLLPAMTAVVLLLLGDSGGEHGHDGDGVGLRRRLSLASVALGLLMAGALVVHAASGELMVYRLGEWPAPFGIVMVVDRLSAHLQLHLVDLPGHGASAGYSGQGNDGGVRAGAGFRAFLAFLDQPLYGGSRQCKKRCFGWSIPALNQRKYAEGFSDDVVGCRDPSWHADVFG